MNFEIISSLTICLQIRDGDYENSTLIGRYCNNTSPSEIISSFNYLWIKFVTDESVGDRGFMANYSVTNIGKINDAFKNTAFLSSTHLYLFE